MTRKTGRETFYKQREMPLAQAYEYASHVMVNNLLRHDTEEGINAFNEKRAPQWSDE